MGVEVNGSNVISKCMDTRSSLGMPECDLHISSSKDSAQSEIDAFYNFVDITMS